MSRIGAVLLLLAAVLLACAAPPEVGQGWYVDGAPVPDEPWRAHDGPFLAMLVITDDPESLYKFWNTKPGNVPVSPLANVAPGASVEAVVFFIGCESDSRGNCDIRGKATVIAPDGRLLADQIEIPLWVGRPAPPGRALGISEHGVGMTNERLPGLYTFRLVVSDRIGNREIQLERGLTIAH
jgi:hypothetical protein